MEKKEIKKDITQKTIVDNRLRTINFVMNILFILLVIHLFLVQVVDLNGYKERGIAIRNSNNPAIRGNILDRNGMKLATDSLTYEVYAHPNYYTKKRPPEILAQTLAPALRISEDELLKLLLSKKFNTITLSKNVDKQTADKIRHLHLREISVGTLNKRFYPQGQIASHIIGYYSHLSKNAIGIENIANDKLANIIDDGSFQRTGNGQIIFDLKTNPDKIIKNSKGEDITLTLDTAVQYICEKALEKKIKETKAERGTVIVMDVKTGEILAYVSSPSFDPNNYWNYSQLQMKNWSLTDVYPPGSTFKIITVATAMELGKINEFSRIPDTGKMKIGKFLIKNYDYDKHPNPGMISLEYLFEHSSNVGSANIALMLNSYSYYQKLRDFGFGQKTGIDLTAESRGLLPKPTTWDKSRKITMGYGYGASVTAIQMISAISAIANNGVWITPHVVKYSADELPNRVQCRRVMTEENAKAVTRLLAKSISNSKSILNMDKYSVAAKTGTSRKNVSNGRDVYTSAIGYFPASNPEIAIYVVVDSPKTGVDWGSTVATPVLKEVILETGKLLNIKPDKASGGID